MQLVVLFCLVAGAFAYRACPENARWNSCGTACPLTCENYQNPPKICVLMCKIGCECEPGYVKAKDGSCVLPENCPAQAQLKSCLGEAEPGLCRAYIPSWHYDVQTGTCHKFIYGGCGGNGNRYATEEECLQHCGKVRPKQSTVEVCDMPAETGVCRGYFKRFAFDSALGECREFVYGGCGGNGNNFLTREECHNTCRAQKALDRPDCDKAAETGHCFGFFPRYYYDQETGMCQEFVYGGCGGNRNNFRTEEECYNKCGAL